MGNAEESKKVQRDIFDILVIPFRTCMTVWIIATVCGLWASEPLLGSTWRQLMFGILCALIVTPLWKMAFNLPTFPSDNESR